MRAADLFSDGVSGKFNVFLAKVAGHFQEIGFAQGDCGLAMWAGDLLATVDPREFNASSTGWAGHFCKLYRLGRLPQVD